MPERISRDQADATLLRIGYELLAEEGGFVRYVDPNYPSHIVEFDFRRGPIPWYDFQRQLEYEGVNVDAFVAHLESM